MKPAFPVFSFLLLSVSLQAQLTEADYQRANGLRNKLQGLAINIPGPVNWVSGTNKFWYRKSVPGGNAFVLANAETLSKSPAFDHEKLAASLSAAAAEKYTAVTLPFSEIVFADRESAIELTAAGSNWRCDLSTYECKKLGPARQDQPGR
ncbi:MAG: peptidase S9, partial [Acidobacteria bacterium]